MSAWQFIHPSNSRLCLKALRQYVLLIDKVVAKFKICLPEIETKRCRSICQHNGKHHSTQMLNCSLLHLKSQVVFVLKPKASCLATNIYLLVLNHRISTQPHTEWMNEWNACFCLCISKIDEGFLWLEHVFIFKIINQYNLFMSLLLIFFSSQCLCFEIFHLFICRQKCQFSLWPVFGFYQWNHFLPLVLFAEWNGIEMTRNEIN